MYQVTEQLTKEQVSKIVAQVRERDYNRCVLHGTANAEVHELLQKSSGGLRSARVFQPKFMACVCRDCHTLIHAGCKKEELTKKILTVLKSRYSYKYTKKELI